MEKLAPSLHLLIEIKFELEKGTAIRAAVTQYVRSRCQDRKTQRTLLRWISAWDDLNRLKAETQQVPSPSLRSVMMVLNRGLAGESILPHLETLKDDVLSCCESELEAHVQSLPIRAMIPLLFFQFPAFAILLLSPFLETLLSS